MRKANFVCLCIYRILKGEKVLRRIQYNACLLLFSHKVISSGKQIKGPFIYEAQKFLGYELKNFWAKDGKFFGY